MYPAVSFWELLQLYIPTGNYRNIVSYRPELVKLEASFGCALLVYMGNEPDCRGSIHHVRVQERATLGERADGRDECCPYSRVRDPCKQRKVQVTYFSSLLERGLKCSRMAVPRKLKASRKRFSR